MSAPDPKPPTRPRVRFRGVEYDVLNFTEDAEWVLRDDAGDVIVFEEGERERVEMRCDRCGAWGDPGVIENAHTCGERGQR